MVTTVKVTILQNDVAISSCNVAAAACPPTQETQILKTVNLFGQSEVLEEWQGHLPNDQEKSISKDLIRIVNNQRPTTLPVGNNYLLFLGLTLQQKQSLYISELAFCKLSHCYEFMMFAVF